MEMLGKLKKRKLRSDGSKSYQHISQRAELFVCLLLALVFTPSQHCGQGRGGNFLRPPSLPGLESGAETLFLVCIPAPSPEPAPRGALPTLADSAECGRLGAALQTLLARDLLRGQRQDVQSCFMQWALSWASVSR